MDFAHSQITSFDGTRLSVGTAGNGPDVVLAGPPFAGTATWRVMSDLLGTRFRLTTWEWRGLFGSSPPATPSGLGFDIQARDLAAVCDAAEIGRAVFVGWSFGAGVLFRLLAERPGLFRGLVLLDAWYGPGGAPVRLPDLGRLLLPGLTGLLADSGEGVMPYLRRLSARPWLLPALQRAGLVGLSIDSGTWTEMTAGFASLDLRLLFETLAAVTADRGTGPTPAGVPALVMTGDRDPLSSVEAATAAARMLGTDRPFVLRTGTHFAHLEFAELAGLRIERFLDQLPAEATRPVDSPAAPVRRRRRGPSGPA